MSASARRSPGERGFFRRRVSIAVLVCAAVAYSLLNATLLAFFHPEASSKVSQRTLTFAERVAHQRAIEEVYWRHRICPKANSGPKPQLDKVMSQAQIEKKVKEYLRNSQALEDYWQQPITSEQLQTEMERIGSQTSSPGCWAVSSESLNCRSASLLKIAVSARLQPLFQAWPKLFHTHFQTATEKNVISALVRHCPRTAAYLPQVFYRAE